MGLFPGEQNAGTYQVIACTTRVQPDGRIQFGKRICKFATRQTRLAAQRMIARRLRSATRIVRRGSGRLMRADRGGIQ